MLVVLLVTCHEAGHYAMARFFSIPVRCCSLGLGPALCHIHDARGTLWVLRLLPLGGYVRMEDIPSEGAPPSVLYHNQSVVRRMLVVLAGPAVNVLLAFLIHLILGMFSVGMHELRVGIPAPHSSAEQAGIKAGDRVVAVNHQELASWESLAPTFMRGWQEGQQQGWKLTVARDQEVFDVWMPHLPQSNPGSLMASWGLSPQYPEVPVVLAHVVPGSPAAEAGLQAGDALWALGKPCLGGSFMTWVQQHPGATREVQVMRSGMLHTHQLKIGQGASAQGFLGVGLKQPADVQHRGSVFHAASQRVHDTAQQILWGLWHMLQGSLSWSHLEGPVRLANHSGTLGGMGWEMYFGFLAYVSMGLAIMNLMPVPGLDGGQALLLVGEVFKGAPWSPEMLQQASRWGSLCVLVLLGVGLYQDALWWLNR